MVLWSLFIILMVTLIGCSGGNKEESADMSGKESSIDEDSKMDNQATESEVEEAESAEEPAAISSGTDSKSTNQPQSNQMIIYHASITIEVKDFNKAKDSLEQLIVEKKGYIANSSSQQISDGQVEGSLSVRIPQEHFQQFLDEIEDLSVKVHHQSIEGMDVTEEYVDLSSRLKSREAVEERLLQFMQEAQKTEDLLKISADLGKIQEEMEQIKGRIKYLQNQVSLSTVEISFTENKIIVPSIDNSELNTWEKTKKQFITSVQLLLSFCSGVFIFLIGNSPVFIILAGLSLLIYLFYRRRLKKNQLPTNHHDGDIS